MTLENVLSDLILRGPKDSGTVSWEEVREWPKEAVEIFQNAGWIKPKEPAQTVVCPGCEENCFMPVHVRKRDDGVIHARIMCDRLDYMGPVPIHSDHLQQWQITDHFFKLKGEIMADHPGSHKPRKVKKPKTIKKPRRK